MDVDWFSGELLVASAISKAEALDGVHKWTWEVGPTKSRKARRVGLCRATLDVLADLKKATADPEDFIFNSTMTGKNGADSRSFIDPDFFEASNFGPIRKEAGQPRLRFHDLRHFYASMLIAQGESPKYVCDQMGHSSIQVTFDVYGHLFPQARKEASARLEEAMFTGRDRTTGRKLVETVGALIRTAGNRKDPQKHPETS